MRWLHWLSANDRKLIRQRIERVAVKQINDRHWGAIAPGSSPGSGPRIYILDIRGLFLAAGVLRYTLGKYDTMVLYRGQRKDWEAQVSLYRGAKTKQECDLRTKWVEDALDTIKDVFDPTGTREEREALAQHYGMRTRWLDAVDNVQTAAWFAYHSSAIAKPNDPGQLDDAVGYISAIACPIKQPRFARVYDLRNKPSSWLRPHIQQAWGLRAEPPDTGLGKLYYLQVATFIIPRPLLRQWSSYDMLTSDVMFPKEYEDRGLSFWRKAEQKLTGVGLFPYPW